jgi:O-antigen ligase
LLVETKDLIGLSLFLPAAVLGVGLTCVSPRLRDLAFFLLVVGAAVTHKLDINFHSHFWYRGTTRGFELSLVDVIAFSIVVSSLLAPRPEEPRWFWPASLGMMLLFFGYACLSVLAAEPKIYGLFELSKMARALLIFLAGALYVRSERELAVLTLALCCVMCVEGAVSIKQRYLDGIHRVTGTIENENSFSMYLCLVAPVLAAAGLSTLPRALRWFCGLALVFATLSIFLTISRAGIPAFALMVLGVVFLGASWRITLKKVAATGLIAVSVAGLVYKTWGTLKARYTESTLAEEYLDETIEGRGYYLRQAKVIVDDRFFGVGLNNWSYWVSKKYGQQLGKAYEDYDDLTYSPSKEVLPSFYYAAPAHNLAALTVGELGVPGLLLFGIVWLRWLSLAAGFLWRRSFDAPRQIAVGIFFGTCGVGLQSLTEWTYRQTHIFMTFHLLLGVLASLCYLRRTTRQRKSLALDERTLDPRATPPYEPVPA